MGFESYSHNSDKKKYIFYSVLVFVFIFGLLIYTAFFSNFSFTGSVIKGDLTQNNSLNFYANLNTPSLELDGEFDEIVLSGQSSGFLYAGDQKFDLNEIQDSYIVLEGFDGDIVFDGDKISTLKGKIETILVNGVYVSSQDGKAMKVEQKDDFFYDSLEISKGVSIKELSYVATGDVALENGKNSFNLQGDAIVMNNYRGSLKINKGKTVFSGRLTEFMIDGKSKISVVA
jgi:hypothetical protein